MERELITEKLERLIAEYIGDIKMDNDSDLMAQPAVLQPHSMAALFLDIEREFSIDLNALVPRLNLFSPRAITDEIFLLVS